MNRFTAERLNINVEALWDFFKTRFLKERDGLFMQSHIKVNPHIFNLDIVDVEVKDEIRVGGGGRGVI